MMRATSHNSRTNSKGRVHGLKHNDRNFDVRLAENIDPTKSVDNIYMNVYHDNSLTFEQAELKFYREHFGKQLEKTNEKYIASRHPEKCKTMEEWKMSRMHCPEETVYQIGDREQHVSRNQLLTVYIDFEQKLEQWNKENGRPFTTLTRAVHADEAVSHVQTRRVWHYTGADGELRIGQEKALKAAGVPLPNPSIPEGRHNNRKMSFDAMARQMWLDTCQEHGIEVEREPLPDGRHNREKEDMIRDKYADMLAAAELAQISADAHEDIALTYQEMAQEAQEQLQRAADDKLSMEREKNALTGDLEALRGIKRDLESGIMSVAEAKSAMQAMREQEELRRAAKKSKSMER